MDHPNITVAGLSKNKHIRALTTLAVIVTSILALTSGYNFIMNNFWVPTIEVIQVDYSNAYCMLKIGGKEKILSGDGTLYINGQWGVRFGTISLSTQPHYDAVELVKNGMVYKTLANYDATKS